MDTPVILTLLISLASAFATVVLAILTAKYVRLTKSLVEEAQTVKLPNVYVDLEFDDADVKLVIGNSGASPAVDLKVSVVDNVPWSTHGGRPTGFSALSIVQNGLTYLAPGRVLKYQAGYVSRDAEFFASGSSVDFTLAYESETGVRVQRQFTIDLSSYSGILYESFRVPEREVARAIRDAELSRRSSERFRGSMASLSKRPCPECREMISSKARKCPNCLHTISLFRHARP